MKLVQVLTEPNDDKVQRNSAVFLKKVLKEIKVLLEAINSERNEQELRLFLVTFIKAMNNPVDEIGDLALGIVSEFFDFAKCDENSWIGSRLLSCSRDKNQKSFAFEIFSVV